MLGYYSYFNKVTGSTLEEVLSEADLDFVAVKDPIHYNLTIEGEDYEVEIPDKCAILRSPGIKLADGSVEYYLGTVGSNYQTVQYNRMFGFTESLVENGDVQYVRAGHFGHGAQAYVVMKTNDKIMLAPDDPVECYFYAASSHNGTIQLEITLAPVRTKTGVILPHPASDRRFRMKFKHTKHVEDRLATAQRGISSVRTYFTEFQTSFKRLQTIRLTDPQMDQYLKMVHPDKKGTDNKQAENRREKIKRLFRHTAPYKLPTTQGTLLGLYLAACDFEDNHATVRKTDGKDAKLAKAQAIFTSAGTALRRKTEAYACALDMADLFD